MKRLLPLILLLFVASAFANAPEPRLLPPLTIWVTNTRQHYYYDLDGSGNVVGLFGTDETMVASYRYDPFGNQLWSTGPQAALNRLRFSGKEWHPQSGLIHFGERDYVPSLGRWTTEDPLGELGGINLFRFVGNDPVNRVDPLGLAWYDWLNPLSYSSGYAALAGNEALDAQAKARGYKNYNDALSQLNERLGIDDIYLDQRLAIDSIKSVANVAKESTELYLMAATSVTPTAAGTRCATLLLPGGKVLGQAGSKAAIRELQGGLKEAQALFDQLAQGGKVVQNSTYPGTLVQLPTGGTVGLRTTMTKSPGTAATIDVNIPGIPIDKIKFNP